jgi:hypothetical protein
MSKEPKEQILLTDDDVTAAPPALMRVGLETLPAAIAAAGADTSERFIEFFTANICNRNTRMAYALAVRQFFAWCEQRGLRPDAIRPRIVAAYIEQLGVGMSKPSVDLWAVIARCAQPRLRTDFDTFSWKITTRC